MSSLTGLVKQFAAKWDSTGRPPDLRVFFSQGAATTLAEQAAVMRYDQARRWNTSEKQLVEDYVRLFPELTADPFLRTQLAVGEFELLCRDLQQPNIDEFSSRFPDLGDSLRSELLRVIDPLRTRIGGVSESRIGKYRILRLLGEGAFGRVWLAYDDDLQRQVAIKVPKMELFRQPAEAELYLKEARAAARLEHPHLVTVYEAGRTSNGGIYVVSKFIDGATLADVLKQRQFTPVEAAALLIPLAEALHHAHSFELIHRDVKPANILIENGTNRAYLADFGLAITTDDSLRQGGAGTPGYMSPEQALAGSRLDGCSDIFSLGVILYELLTGVRPFQGHTVAEVLAQTANASPTPPRQLNPQLPESMEQVCQRAIAKRPEERFASAQEFANALRACAQALATPPYIPPTLLSLHAQFQEESQAWLTGEPAANAPRARWFGPQCSLLAFAQAMLSAAEAEPNQEQANRIYQALASSLRAGQLLTGGQQGHERCAAAALTHLKGSEKASLAQARCAATMRGLLAAVQAAMLLSQSQWRPGSALPAEASTLLQQAVAAYATAWGLAAAPSGPAEFAPQREMKAYPRALSAVKEAVPLANHPAPACWAVDRLLDYLLGGVEPTSDPAAVAGSPANPVRLRVLFAGGAHGGAVHDLLVCTQQHGPRSWFLDPVALGLTVLLPDLIESLQLGWAACLALQPLPPPIQLRPRFAGVQAVDGPSAGALFACGMYAALTGTEINSDASASVALRITQPTPQSISLDQIELSRVGGLEGKLPAAHAAGLSLICLTPEQAAEAERIPWYAQYGGNLSLRPVQNLNDVLQALTGNAQIEKVLRIYGQEIVQEWEKAWTDPHPLRGSLVYYVPPAYRLFKNSDGPQAPDRFANYQRATISEERAGGLGERKPPFQDFDLPHEEDTLAQLLKEGGMRLCLSEGPGAGKTTFTRRLLGFLGSSRAQQEFGGGKALLPVRWEDSSLSRDGHWPDDFRQAFADKIEAACQTAKFAGSPADVVEYALRNGRVILILDALDQAQSSHIKAFIAWLDKIRREKLNCRIVLTGRPYAVHEQQRLLVTHDDWRFGAILPFDLARQLRYLHGPETDPTSPNPVLRRDLSKISIQRLVGALPAGIEKWQIESTLQRLLSQRFPFYRDVQLLLGNPNTLFMVRKLHATGESLDFRSRSELYQRSCRFLLKEAKERQDGVRNTSERDLTRWQAMLAAAAFSLMERDPKSFRIDGGEKVQELLDDASQRVAQRPSDEEWQRVKKVAGATNRSVLYGADDEVWAFPDRRMMEFYSGLHLARNTEPGWVREPEGEQGPIRCGNLTVRAHAADPDWAEAFKFAQELPPDVREDRVLLATLAELFEPVTQPASGGPWLRPTELIYRSWCLLDQLDPREQGLTNPVLLPGGERVLQAYWRQLDRLLAKAQSADDVICQLVPLEKLVELLLLTPQQAAARTGVQSNFAEIPATGPEGFVLGKGRAAHRVALERFLLATTTVTREQYALFDGAYLKAKKSNFERFTNCGPRCPANYTNWRDAWCFARWCGGRLPTDAEWEFACRAGSRKNYCRILDPTVPGGYRDLVTEAELAAVAYFGQEVTQGPQAVGQLLANAWGLFDMHGNVWEWCRDWYDDGYYQELADKITPAPRGPLAGLERVTRGGSFGNASVSCRSAFRFRDFPELGDDSLGFRLALVPSSPARKAEPVA